MVVGPGLKQLGSKAYTVLQRSAKGFGRQNSRATQDVFGNDDNQSNDSSQMSPNNVEEHIPPVTSPMSDLGSNNNNNNRRPKVHFKNVVPTHYLCPITHEIMEDPVTVASGHTFERKAILSWFNDGNNINPVTGQELPNTDIRYVCVFFTLSHRTNFSF